jgi:hypothetical protein
MDDFIKAVDHLIHLHMCEQEGIGTGMPTPDDWYKAVCAVCEERRKIKQP